MPDGSAPSPMTATLWRSVSPVQIVADLRPERRRDAATGVAGHEQVVFALVRIGVAHQAALGADAVEIA